MIPPYGTLAAFIFATNGGAEPPMASARSTRPVEYSPELRLESAAVRTTMFITVPIPGTPNAPKNVTKGLTPEWYAVHGMSRTKSTTDPT